ncbi:MAG TPA: hypothetical protein VGH83_09845 [Candidatus Acidoferrum sp.]|jgi:hypothetical protein
MKKLLLATLFVFLMSPVVLMAQDAFDGTWKVDMSKAQMPKKPDVYVLQGGMYHCKTCVPPVDVKADGQDQAVSGHPYYDTKAVKVVDDRTIEETDKKDGKVVTTSKMIVSADGKTAVFEFEDSSASNSQPVTGKGEMTRVAKGPAGSHAISGSWRATKFDSLSDNGTTFTYKVEGDTLSMTTPTGQSYSAKLDGTDSPYKGDPGTTSVSVKRLGKNSIEEIDKRDGKVLSVSKATVAADGKTMNVAWSDKLHGTSGSVVAIKQ